MSTIIKPVMQNLSDPANDDKIPLVIQMWQHQYQFRLNQQGRRFELDQIQEKCHPALSPATSVGGMHQWWKELCHIQKVKILYHPFREFGTRSIGIHVPKCIEKWETQQEKLPKVGIYTTGRMPWMHPGSRPRALIGFHCTTPNFILFYHLHKINKKYNEYIAPH